MLARFLIFLGLIGLAEVYSFIVVRSALRTFSNPWKTGITILYILLTLLTWSSILLFRKIDWASLPHMARNVYIAFTLGFFVGKILILVVMLGDDIRRGVIWISRKIVPPSLPPDTVVKGISRSLFLSRLALILGGTALTGFLYGITNRYNYHVRKLRLSFNSLPPAFKGLRIVQISDIHSGSFDSHDAVARGAKMVMDLKPDIVFFTGDLVNNKSEEILPYMDIFSGIKAPMGVYSTLGNHDYGDYVEWPSKAAKIQNLEVLKNLHAQLGWRLLMNEHIVLEKGSDKIAVIGIENWSAKANFPKYGDMAKAYKGLPEKQVPFQILLSHDPSHWDAQVNTDYKDVNLTLAGHTHGMQFGVEIPGLKWSPVQYLYQKWAGLYQVGAQFLYVNRGFGFLGYPGRLGIMPEITVIDLV